MTDIHSCSPYCELPACIKQQRDKMRDKPWVGLTHEEVGDLSDFAYTNDEEFVRNVEAKIKENT